MMVTLPPAFSTFSLADLLQACTSIDTLASISPSPRSFTLLLLSIRPLATKSENDISSLSLPASIKSATVCTFKGLYSVLKRFLKPNFGNLLCKGICPPSKQGFNLLPLRDFCPLCPRPDCSPKPEP